ncbi:MAG: hypothetical protein R3321_08895 [Nitrososphaeraceae archaeon]|nr:hypothetical protein [Nitrososphaeraceae archaeon]
MINNKTLGHPKILVILMVLITSVLVIILISSQNIQGIKQLQPLNDIGVNDCGEYGKCNNH